jgi:hypothetical protein
MEDNSPKSETPTTSLNVSASSAASKNGRLLCLTGLVPILGLVVSLWLFIKRSRRLALVTLLVSVLSSVGYSYIYTSTHHKTKAPVVSSNATAYKLSPTGSVDGAQTGSGATFVVPSGFRPSNTLNSSVNSAYLKQVTTNGHTITNGNVRALAIPMPAAQLTSSLALANATLSPSSASKDNKNATLQFVTFIQNSLTRDYNPVLSAPTPLQTANIKSNAWQFDFTAASTSQTTQPTMKGVVIYAFGKSAIYYFLVTAAQDDWTANPSTWAEVINSLKIDQ